MERYKSLKQKYPFYEAFRHEDIGRAVQLFASLIGKRLGSKLNLSSLSGLFSNSQYGDMVGVIGIFDNGSAIKFNWKLGKSSGEIDTIDFWESPSNLADKTIDLSGQNAIQVIDTIVDAIQNSKPGDVYQELQERIDPKTKGSVSKEISKSINTYFSTFGITDRDLENRRISSELYNEYMYWYDQLSDEDVKKYKLVPKPTFLNYIKVYMSDNGIVNKFSRKVIVRKASKEILRVSKNDSDKFKALYSLSLEDKMDLIAMGVVAVTKGFKMSSLISGVPGIGKSRKVIETLKGEGAKYKYISGGIKNARALYQILYENNDRNLILVFDDVNDILRNKQAVEILRTATTNDRIRKITYVDTKITPGSRKYKPELDFESKIIIITNIPIKKIDKAIVSRTTPVEVIVTPQEIVDNIRVNLNDAPPPSLPIKWKQEVWDFIVDVIGISRISRIDYRIFEQCCIFRATESPKWMKFAVAYVS
jgi:hypothetical protein